VLIDLLPLPKPKPDLVFCVVGRELAGPTEEPAGHGCTSDMECEEPFLRTIFADSTGDLINQETRRVGPKTFVKSKKGGIGCSLSPRLQGSRSGIVDVRIEADTNPVDEGDRELGTRDVWTMPVGEVPDGRSLAIE